jgi:hypothetical protein
MLNSGIWLLLTRENCPNTVVFHYFFSIFVQNIHNAIKMLEPPVWSYPVSLHMYTISSVLGQFSRVSSSQVQHLNSKWILHSWIWLLFTREKCPNTAVFHIKDQMWVRLYFQIRDHKNVRTPSVIIPCIITHVYYQFSIGTVLSRK